MPLVRDKFVRVLFDEELIAERNRAMAEDIAAAGYKDLLVILILKGSFIFGADLVRALYNSGLSPDVETMSLSSYGDEQVSSGKVQVQRDGDIDVNGRDILLVDDILESGRTLAHAREMMMKRGANRVDSAVLLNKPKKRVAEFEAAFTGFECPDVFVVGYGMDAANAFRELPFVGVIED